jgi:hypothetical protein
MTDQTFFLRKLYRMGAEPTLRDEQDFKFDHLTNFAARDRVAYEVAALSWSGRDVFGICEQAYGNDGRIILNMLSFGVLAGERDFGLSEFWTHFDKIKTKLTP